MGGRKKGMEMSSSFMAESKLGYCLNMRDFTGSPVVKTLHFQCRGHRFHPWLGN